MNEGNERLLCVKRVKGGRCEGGRDEEDERR